MAKKSKKDPLDLLAEGDPKKVIELILWKARHQHPDLSVKITQKDIDGYEACTQYLDVKPGLLIVRPQGRPAQAPIAAVGKNRAVPGYPAEPPRPYVVVQVVEEGTENMIRPVENNEEDNKLRIQAEEIKRVREGAPDLARRVEQMIGPGAVISESDLRDAAKSLRLLAQ